MLGDSHATTPDNPISSPKSPLSEAEHGVPNVTTKAGTKSTDAVDKEEKSQQKSPKEVPTATVSDANEPLTAVAMLTEKSLENIDK